MTRPLWLHPADGVAPARPAGARRVYGAVAAAALAGLAGCSGLAALDPTGNAGAASAAAATAPAVPDDPLLAFAAGAGPSGTGYVHGQPVRLARAYTAASGRECRELLIGGGAGERSALVCRDELTGAWAHARPLLRGGGGGLAGGLRP